MAGHNEDTQIKVNADEFSGWLSDMKTIQLFIHNSKNGTIFGSFARLNAEAAIKNVDRVIDDMKAAYRRSF